MIHPINFSILDSNAAYILEKSGNTNAKSALILIGKEEDYISNIVRGFKKLFGTECHEFPRLNVEQRDSSKGTTMINDIINHYYDIIVYPQLDKTPLLSYALEHYSNSEIIFICEDLQICYEKFKNYNIFVREL